MSQAHLHRQLMEACKNNNLNQVKECLEAGAEPNFNLQTAINALEAAIEVNNHEMIRLLLEHNAVVKANVLQRAIEKEKQLLELLIPDFKACTDIKLFTALLQAAMNINDFRLAKKAIEQGADPKSLFLFSITDFGSTNILQLLIENGFDIHANENVLLSEWMGTCLLDDWGRRRAKREDFLIFIADYYVDKPKSIEKFHAWRKVDKTRLFRMGLQTNNFNMMKFALLIGVNKNEALNSVLFHYYAYKQGNTKSNDAKMIFKNEHSEKIVHEIIEYILNSNIKFSNLMISNAVCFNYTKLLNALTDMDDLVYGYEMAYKYKNETASLKSLYNAGLVLDHSLNAHLNHAMNNHNAYETISYLIELGLDISQIQTIPLEYKIAYPFFSDMWEKKFTNIFNYTIYLAHTIYPKAEGKEREAVLKCLAEFSSLPYVVEMSKVKSLEQT